MAYNTTFHSSAQITPFEIVYGQPPPIHLPYLPGESSCTTIDRSLQKREILISTVKFHLLRAQNRMKQLHDKHRTYHQFNIGDSVYLKLQPYRQHSMKNLANQKLSPRFYGLLCIIDKIGNVSYKLQLPSASKIHNVFHVSQLKKCHSPPTDTHPLPQFLLDIGKSKEPETILDKRVVKRRNEAATKVLVQWKGGSKEQATWEFYKDLIAKYPNFHP